MTTTLTHGAVLDGLHPTWTPALPILGPFMAMPLRVGSFYDPRVAHSDVFLSNELTMVRPEGDTLHWRQWGRQGTTSWFMGTPYVASPRALHVPYFYWRWSWPSPRPRASTVRARGVSFVASNAAHGALAQRRLGLAVALSHHIPVHVNSALRPAIPAGSRVHFHDVPRGPHAKRAFLERFTFNLSFENAAAPGYLTEKPVDALLAGAVPLYEGDPDAARWFADDTLIDCTALSAEAILDRIHAAELAGLPARVAAQREALMAVPFEEMMGRIWRFAGQVQLDLAAREPDWRDPNRVKRLRLMAAPPSQRRLAAVKAIIRPLADTPAVRLAQRLLRGFRQIP